MLLFFAQHQLHCSFELRWTDVLLVSLTQAIWFKETLYPSTSCESEVITEMPKRVEEIIEHVSLPYFENSKQFSYAYLHSKGKQMSNAVASFISAKKNQNTFFLICSTCD